MVFWCHPSLAFLLMWWKSRLRRTPLGGVTIETNGSYSSTCQLCGYKKNVDPPAEECSVRLVVGFGAPDRLLSVQCGQAMNEPTDNPGDQFNGFRFFWWSLSQGGEAFDFDTPITSDTTLYAVYRQLYTFVFNDRGNISSQSVADGELFTPNDSNLINDGYTLACRQHITLCRM